MEWLAIINQFDFPVSIIVLILVLINAQRVKDFCTRVDKVEDLVIGHLKDHAKGGD